mmetsp:Transcript_10901/g.22206  ORF Transcript_10901/g.22206 Transcript_10901/m.22206 type:complete len:144 (-) Transcript_10901:2746-3177(-)
MSHDSIHSIRFTRFDSLDCSRAAVPPNRAGLPCNAHRARNGLFALCGRRGLNWSLNCRATKQTKQPRTMQDTDIDRLLFIIFSQEKRKVQVRRDPPPGVRRKQQGHAQPQISDYMYVVYAQARITDNHQRPKANGRHGLIPKQ